MSSSLHDHIETIESGYEFLLAYAAQGRDSDTGSEVRSILTGMSAAADNIAQTLDGTDFNAVVVEDARKAGAAMSLVLSQSQIGSELVDNLNASIHLRAFLTDLFLLSETGD